MATTQPDSTLPALDLDAANRAPRPHAAHPATPRLRVQLATTPAERERIYRFRYEIYVRELGKPLSCADHEHSRLTDPADDGALHFYATDGDRIVGTLRLHLGNVPAETLAKTSAERLEAPQTLLALVSKTMVCQDRRGSIVFLALARTAMDVALAAGIRFGLLHCRPALVPFYTRLGYSLHGERFVDPEVGEQVPMVLDLHRAPDLLQPRTPQGHAA